MKMISLLALATCLFIGDAQAARPVALVYRGKGACAEGCAEAAARVAERAGLTVRFVHFKTLTPDVFRDAVVWIQPGGNAIDIAQRITPEHKEMIRDFLRRGGGYLGFCAGAFFADTTVDDAETLEGLGIIPGSTADFMPKDKSPKILPVTWRGKLRHLYFEEGATFKLPAKTTAHVIATYADGRPATIEARYGSGRVVVAGVHPEAPDSWRQAAGLVDPDGDDTDLAEEMLLQALGER